LPVLKAFGVAGWDPLRLKRVAGEGMVWGGGSLMFKPRPARPDDPDYRLTQRLGRRVFCGILGAIVVAGLALPDVTAKAQGLAKVPAAAWLHAYSPAPSLWVTVPARSPAERYQTQAFCMRESTDIELHPAGHSGTFTHLRFRVCLLDRGDKYVAAEGFATPRWSMAGKGPRAAQAKIVAEVYDQVGDRFRQVLKQTVSGRYEPAAFDIKLPFALTPGKCVVRIDVSLGEGTQALVYEIAPYAQTAQPQRVVFLSLDTHALQHLTLNQTRRIDTSPTLRKLVREDPHARLYAGATGASSWTLPTHATMFTGLYPTQHGLIDTDEMAEISPEVQMVPELLAARGVQTFHLASHSRVGFAYGYYRGVGHYQQYDQPLGKRGRQVLGDAVRLMRGVRDRDVFMFVHLFDAHLPYTNYPRDYRHEFKGITPRSPDALCQGKLYREQIYGDEGWRYSKRQAHIRKFGRRFERQMKSAQAAYELGLRDVDDMIGEFIRGLKDAGLWRETTLVIVGDHGEEFFEHGLLTHTSLYPQNISVPFILRLGENAPGIDTVDPKAWNVPYRFEAHTTAFHVLLDLFGVPAPDYLAQAGTHGLALSEMLGLDKDHPAFAEFYLRPASNYHEAALISQAGEKVIVATDLPDPTVWQDAKTHTQLYDERRDPVDQHNLFDPANPAHQRARQRVVEMAREIRRLTFAPTRRGKLTSEQIKKLRALGYVH